MFSIKKVMIVFCGLMLISCATISQENKPIEPSGTPATQSSPLEASSPSSTPANSVIRQTGEAEVTIPASFKACQKSEECVLVDTGCDQCCQEQAINKQFSESFSTQFGLACKGYEGGVCDCAPAGPSEAICEKKQCVVASKPVSSEE